MKVFWTILISGIIFASCSTVEVEPYNGSDSYLYFLSTNKVRLDDSMYIYSNTVYLKGNKLRDTIYFRVGVSGLLSDKDRTITLEQYTINGDQNVQAVAGVNYVAFDDPEMKDLLVFSADSAQVNIPIILTYDPESAGQYFNRVLSFRLAENEDFKLLGAGTNRGLFRARVNLNQSN